MTNTSSFDTVVFTTIQDVLYMDHQLVRMLTFCLAPVSFSLSLLAQCSQQGFVFKQVNLNTLNVSRIQRFQSRVH